MRGLAVVLLVALAGVAAARRVVMMPTIPDACPGGDSWEVVATCLAKYGELTVEKKLPGAVLVRLGDKGAGYRVPGLYIYVNHGKRWQLGGMLDGATEYALFGFQRVTLGLHEGFRFDVGISEQSALSLDGETSVEAMHQRRLAVFCPGTSHVCTAILTACDLFVDGKSYYSFRGKLRYAGDEVVVDGDPHNAGSVCTQPARVALGWQNER